jgi:predicted DNA binding CopG/RHH family protein
MNDKKKIPVLGKVVHFRVTKKEQSKIERKASSKGMRVSRFLRELVLKILNNGD